MAPTPQTPDPEAAQPERSLRHAQPRPAPAPEDTAPRRPFRFTDWASL